MTSTSHSYRLHVWLVQEYKAKKEEAAQFLWSAVEKSVPGARGRAVLEMVGTPLTHERFLRRDRGTYGPRIEAGGDVNLTGHKTPLPGFYMTGDSTFPGIGVPAVAAAGAITANTILSIPQVSLRLTNPSTPVMTSLHAGPSFETQIFLSFFATKDCAGMY